jgi:protein arginine kinase
MSRFEPADNAAWLSKPGPDADVVVSSRVRLARNLAGRRFTHHADEDEQLEAYEASRDAVMESKAGDGFAGVLSWLDLNDLPELDRHVLVERNLISRRHAESEEPRGVALTTPDESLSVMVGEEDHLRMQVIQPGFAVERAFERVNAADDAVEAVADYAYSPKFGYLTACPTNVGTGIRVSVMLHLPALKMNAELDKVQRAAKALSLAVRGLHGEGSDAVGDLYQFSNQSTLGKSEMEIVETFSQKIVPRIVGLERAARRTLLDKRRIFFEDQVHRALGMLRSARLMKADEAFQLLSHVRLGIAAGVVEDVELTTVAELLLLVQPGHLQRSAGREMDQAERRIERARMIRERLGA